MRILIVEDEVLIAALLEDMLAELGHESIGPAGTVETALAIIADYDLGAAIVDLNLNGVRAYPVAEVLSQRGIPFIFTTGYASDELPKEWQDIRALQKPFSAPQLGSALKAVIAQ